MENLEQARNKKILSWIWTITCWIVVICFLFPAAPGVTFVGGFWSALFIMAGVFAVSVALVIGLLIGGLVAFIRFDIPADAVEKWFENYLNRMQRWGFTLTTLVHLPVAILWLAVCLKVASFFSSTLSFNGFTPAIGAASIYVIVSYARVIWDRDYLSPARFQEYVSKAIAEIKDKKSGNTPVARVDEVEHAEVELNTEHADVEPKTGLGDVENHDVEHRDGDHKDV
jgi:hypothetical protein